MVKKKTSITIHTGTTSEPSAHEDVQSNLPVHGYPDVFQHVEDESHRLTPMRSTAHGFRIEPEAYTYSEQENADISRHHVTDINEPKAADNKMRKHSKEG